MGPTAGEQPGPGPNPYCFVVGAARSGTTLLQRVLDAHSMLAVVNETYWLLPRYGSPGDDLTRPMTPALVQEILDRPKFAKMGLSGDQVARLLADAPTTRHGVFVSKIFDLYARDRGKPFAGDKTPGYVRKMDRLHRLWPGARFVHIIRDGRDVSLSMLHWPQGEHVAGRLGAWSEDPISTTALYWRRSVLMGRQSGAALGSMYREIRYESLVTAFPETCQDLCRFLGLPFDQAMLSFHEGRTRADGDSKARWLPPTPGLRDWRTQMEAAHAERFEAVCGDLLDDLGYARHYPRPSAQARTQAAGLKEAYTRDALAGHRRLPLGW